MIRHVAAVFACVFIALAMSACGNVENLPDADVAVDVVSPDTAQDDVPDQDIVVTPDVADVTAVDDAADVSGYQDVVIPQLDVEPASVDFGFCAQNTPKMAQITLTNSGHADLIIEKLEITDPSTTAYGNEFAIVFNQAFAPTSPTDPASGTIAAGASVVVELSFTNKGPVAGDTAATLVITSNAPGQGTVEVPMTAKRTSEPVCRLEVVPAFGNFGTVAVGFDATRSMRLVNTGTGSCQVNAAKIVACPADVNGEPLCPADMDGAASGVFEIVTESSGIGLPILAGAQREFQVRYTPSAETAGAGPAGQVWALTLFRVEDGFTGLNSIMPECDGPCDPNLVGYVAAGQAKALPSDIDFGLVIPGCMSRQRQVCVYNTGLIPVVLESVSITDCGDEFDTPDLQQLPQYIHAEEPICFALNYVPNGSGTDDCVMRITVNGADEPVIDIPVRGAGVVEAAQVDEFVQQRSDTVDILFVIDDSGSMCDEQAVLLDSFENFIERARVWNNEFHIGVINVDVTDPAVAGRLNRGAAEEPRYLLPSPSILEDFPALAGIGCDGSSFVEAGLHAALTALMPPLTTDTTVECLDTADCTANSVICPDGEDCPYACVDGTCAGFNKGFLRDDARLEVIVLSDEDDQSALPVDNYVSMLQDLKSGLGEDMVHLHAIVGVTGVPLPGDEYGDCTSASGSTAVEGARYIAAADATGGVVGSICEASFDEVMLDISEKAFTDGGSLKYFLSRPADSATIVVAIQTPGYEPVECVGGFQYDAEGGYVILDPSGSCVPDVGDTIRISYQVPCLND